MTETTLKTATENSGETTRAGFETAKIRKALADQFARCRFVARYAHGGY